MIIDYYSELSKSNYWFNQKINVGIERKQYINNITGYIGNKLIKVLSGQRGCGKSFILKQLIHHLLNEGVSPKNILYINKTFTDTLLLVDKEDLQNLISIYHQKIHPVGKVYIFIEEIQNIANWYELISALSQSYSMTYELFLSSSNKCICSQIDAQSLKTIINFEIMPFNYHEFLMIKNLENNKKGYIDYINKGYLYRNDLQDHAMAVNNLSLLKNSILYKDIIQKYRIKDAFLLENVFLFIAQHLSELISINTIVRHLKEKGIKSSYETVASYISCLEDTFIIHRIDRYQIKSREIISASSKFYINTWSFIFDLYPFLNYDADTKLRNQVYLELYRHQYKIYTGVNKAKMIDFVAQKEDRIIYFQCADSVYDEGLLLDLYNSLGSIQDHYEKWIVSLDEEQLPSKNGIRHIQAWNLTQIL